MYNLINYSYKDKKIRVIDIINCNSSLVLVKHIKHKEELRSKIKWLYAYGMIIN